jgi:LysR family hydrogen peroxide-inducible transcriptional activator
MLVKAMTLQELRFIVTLAREKHFGKASAACFVSQPTLSIAVRKLEDSLGVVLFERNKNDVRVTPIGERIIEQARRVLEEAEVLKHVAQSDQDQLTGTFKLGVIYTIGPYILPPLIKQLNKLAPTMPLEIREDFTGNLREKLRGGEVDAIVISLPFTEPGIITEVLYEEDFAVLMPENHPLTKFKNVNEKDLMKYNMLLLEERHCFRDQVISSCPSCFTAIKSRNELNWRTVEGSSLETVRHMVASGMGLTILPMTAATTDLCPYRDSFLTLRPLRGVAPRRSVALAWRKTFPRVKAVEMMLKAISHCDLPGATK